MPSTWPEKYKHHSNTEDPQDRQELDFLYNFSEADFGKVDVDQAWNRVHSRIQPKTGFDYSLLWKIAAVLILAGGIAFSVVEYGSVLINQEMVAVQTTDHSRAFRLPDGSTVTLAPNSSLSFVEGDFLEKREIAFEGEGFFEVAKNKSTFTIHASGAEVEVLGTSFNLATRGDLNLFVTSGLVAIKTPAATRQVNPGQLASASHSGEITVQENTDPNLLSWKTGVFTFNDTELSQVFQYLEKYYKVQFTANKELAACKVTVDFDKKPLSEIVEVLSTILGAKSNTTGKEIGFLGTGCK